MPDTSPPPRRYPWLQGLRAVAALSVAFVHVAHDAIVAGRDPTGLIASATHFMPWAAGVDLFFVISGFVIVHASAGLFAAPNGASRFLRRRLTRIVPLYWALTTLFLAMLLLHRSAIQGEMGGGGFILASYLFIPWPRPDGLVEPALGLGWTLNYEMFFYFILTPFLLLPRIWAVLGCAATLCLLVAAGQLVGFGQVALKFWSDPIILEFVVGMGIALAVAHGMKLPATPRLAMVAVACCIFHILADGAPFPRVIAFGIPSALLVIAAVSGHRQERATAAMRGLTRLGDASYALYLFHPFVMRGLTLISGRFAPPTAAGGIFYILLSLTTAQFCAIIINSVFERNINRR